VAGAGTWRLLAPKKLPADLDSLKYPNPSGYQLAVLCLQYKQPASAANIVPPETDSKTQ
jgi:hypothetical protein